MTVPLAGSSRAAQSEAMIRPLASLLALTWISACASPTPAVREARDTRASEEFDALEALYRYQFEHNRSSATAQGTVSAYYLSLGDGGDPPPEVLERFADHVPPVLPASRKPAGPVGVLLRVGAVRWIDGDTIECEGGYWEASLSSARNTYRLKRGGEGWAVVSARLNSIS